MEGSVTRFVVGLLTGQAGATRVDVGNFMQGFPLLGDCRGLACGCLAFVNIFKIQNIQISKYKLPSFRNKIIFRGLLQFSLFY